MDKRVEKILDTLSSSDSVIHGGPGSGRYPKGSTGNTPGSARQLKKKSFDWSNMTTVPGRKALYKDDAEERQKSAVKEWKKKPNPESWKNMSEKDRQKVKAENDKKFDKKLKDLEDQGYIVERSADGNSARWYKPKESSKKDEKTKETSKPKEQADSNKAEKTEKPQQENPRQKENTIANLKAAGNIATTTGNAISNQGVSIAKAVNKIKNAKNMEDYTNMSTSELKAKTERIIAENNYVTASMAKTTAAQQKVEGFLTIAGNVIAVTGGALQVAALFKQMKK